MQGILLNEEGIEKILKQNEGFMSRAGYTDGHCREDRLYLIFGGKLFRISIGKKIDTKENYETIEKYETAEKCDLEETRNFLRNHMRRLNLDTGYEEKKQVS